MLVYLCSPFGNYVLPPLRMLHSNIACLTLNLYYLWTVCSHPLVSGFDAFEYYFGEVVH